MFAAEADWPVMAKNSSAGIVYALMGFWLIEGLLLRAFNNAP